MQRIESKEIADDKIRQKVILQPREKKLRYVWTINLKKLSVNKYA